MPQPQQESFSLADSAEEHDEVARWRAVEARLRSRCSPLAHLVGHKSICWATRVSGGELSKQMSDPEKHIDALPILYLARTTEDEELNRIIVCDVLGFKKPERAHPPTLQEENERLRAEVARLKAGIAQAAALVRT